MRLWPFAIAALAGRRNETAGCSTSGGRANAERFTPRSAVVGLSACRVAAAGGRHVDVVKVAVSAALRPAWGVVNAPPDRVLDAKYTRVLQHVCHDLVAERDSLGTARVRDHHVEGQAVRMPPQRIGAKATDFVDLGELLADVTRGQNGSDLQAPLRGYSWRQRAVDDPIS